MYDVLIIGAGVSGAAVARELSRYRYDVLVLEAASDVCEGTSKANSGIVHAGFDCEPGTLMAKLNVRGNALMEPLSRELDFAFRRNGSLVLCFAEEDMPRLLRLKEKGEANGVPGLEILSGDEVRRREPRVSGEVTAALYAPTGGIVCPFELTIALAENAAENGVAFRMNSPVTAVEKTAEGFRVRAAGETYEAKAVVNAAGVYADRIHNMVSGQKMTITPRKGEYCLFDKKLGDVVSHTLFQLPTAAGKGVLVTPTVHGNLMLGPTAVDQPDKEDTATTAEGMANVLAVAARSVPGIPANQVITSFTGLRARGETHDFIICEAEDVPGFVDVAGIQSPGLTSAPAIGEYAAAIVRGILPAEEKEHFKATRQGIPHIAEMSDDERRALISRDPAFSKVVCRCELVTEGEILAAIHRPLGATTADGVKRRTRAGMGRCQSGFCSPTVARLLARELGVDIDAVTKCGGKSAFLEGFNKEAAR